ncbi:MAG: WYL domain-containing protein [Bacteroidaceae bacterium]|nr:WYL domain-containing protein [Bacteroidaceae bacterium]
MYNSVRNKLKLIIDEQCSGGQFITYKEILCKYYGEPLSSIGSLPEHSSLKNLICELRRNHAIEFKNGVDAKEGFRYVSGKAAFFRKKEERKLLEQKVGDDRRLFLIGGLEVLLNHKVVSEPPIQLECIIGLKNIKLVKDLANFYLGKQVISFRYEEGYKNLVEVTIHPHLLKEYNSRWFLFGYGYHQDGSLRIENRAIDRILYRKLGDIKPHKDIEFIPAPRDLYKDYFKDIVGVSKNEGTPEIITIRTTEDKVHNLIKTKPIHPSQKEIKQCNNKEGVEGEFIIEVIPNIELQKLILGYGSGVYVPGDGEFQKRIRETVSRMARMYDYIG